MVPFREWLLMVKFGMIYWNEHKAPTIFLLTEDLPVDITILALMMESVYRSLTNMCANALATDLLASDVTSC